MASETITTMETEQTTMETEQTKEISKVVYFKLRLPASADNKTTFPRLNDLCKQHGDAYSLFYNGYTQAIAGVIQLKEPYTIAEARALLEIEGSDIYDASEVKKEKDQWKHMTWAETKIDNLYSKRVEAVKDKKNSKKDKVKVEELVNKGISVRVLKHPNEDEDRPKFPFPSPPKKTKSPWGEWETEKEKEQRLKEEKEEDQEFERQLNIQLKRRIRDNRDKNYSTDSFGSGKRRKSISEKV